ncbi:3-oxo-tetronate 4-phosphate decarboxylase [Marinomonas sp. TW1]|uniref:3-oxo-tetronate 4-phosphate decarboxylase n=1 Tax=Marinomonas sp. TW1 TaxID=1561203 RepID=UPI0007AFE0F6|nr:aldolase [Marinomonas sp. TW1]KZN13987.1 aldolase [Marinomonas sp. TW1]
MTEQEQRIQVVALAKSMFDRGYATGGAGNLSVKIDDNRLLTTPTGASFGRLEPDNLSVVSMSGEHLAGNRPSKEVAFHLELYRNRPDCNAVVHLHSTYLTALSCLKGLDSENVMRAFTPYYVMRVGQLPLIPYYNPGDKQIAVSVGELAKNNSAFLLANHGPIVSGKDLLDAVDNAEELEETAKLFFILSGQNIAYISDENIDILKRKKP